MKLPTWWCAETSERSCLRLLFIDSPTQKMCTGDLRVVHRLAFIVFHIVAECYPRSRMDSGGAARRLGSGSVGRSWRRRTVLDPRGRARVSGLTALRSAISV